MSAARRNAKRKARVYHVSAEGIRRAVDAYCAGDWLNHGLASRVAAMAGALTKKKEREK